MSSSSYKNAGHVDLYASQMTIPSDSEIYDGTHDPSESSPSPSPNTNPGARMVIYSPPTLWSLGRSAAINVLLPFINGLMLGFGELFANELAFRLGWSTSKIFPLHRVNSRQVGPGVEMRDDPIERRRRSGQEFEAYTSLE